jgi:hypothetical protein
MPVRRMRLMTYCRASLQAAAVGGRIRYLQQRSSATKSETRPVSHSQHYMPLEAFLHPHRFRLMFSFWCSSLACASSMQLVLQVNLGRVKQAPPHTCSQTAPTNTPVYSILVDHPPAPASAEKDREPWASCGRRTWEMDETKDLQRHCEALQTDLSHHCEHHCPLK